MSNTNNTMQTQTSNALHNAIMEAGGKDRLPMLAPIAEGSSGTTTEGYMENYKNVSQDIRDQLNAEAKVVQIILTGIDNDIYSIVDACPNACEMFYKMMNELVRNQCDVTNHQVNVQFLLQLQREWQRFVTLVKQSQDLKTISYHKLYDILKQHQNEVNKIRAKRLASATINRGKAIVNSYALIYDQEPATVTGDDKIRANQDNSPRINRGSGYENQRVVNVDGARENVGTQVVQKYGIQCYNCKEYGHVSRECQKPKRAKDAAYHKEKMLLCKQEEAGVQLNAEQADWKDDTDDESDDQELEEHYMYMAQIQEVTPDAADISGPIFDDEPLQKVQNDDDNYNVFDNDREHLEFANEPYPVEQDEHNIIIDSLDMCYKREQDDQDDTDELAQECDLHASLIEKLKCEINDNKNHNKFLESSNKALVDKLEDLKKFQDEHDRYHDVNYASKVVIDCAKAKGDLMSYKIESEKSSNEYTRKINDLNQTISDMKKELFAHQETISIISQEKEAQIKFYKTHEDIEIDKVIALENKVKVLDDIVYKTGQSVQTMNMLNRNCKTSFAKPEFLKKAQRANPRLYDIGCYNDNLALMLSPESDETIRLAKESRSKLSDLIRPFDYDQLNNLYDLFVPQREKSPEQQYFSKESKMSHTSAKNENSKESFNKQTTLLEKRMDESIMWDQKEYYYADHINAILGVYTTLDEFTDLQCDYVDQVVKCERLEKELLKSRTMSKSFEALQKHAINLELSLQQCKEQIKNDKSFKENQSNVFLKEREQYFEIQDLKAQLQDKGIAISELKKLIEKMKGKYVETKFEKSLVFRQSNAFKSQRQSVLGKPAIFSDSLAKTDFSKSKVMPNNSQGKKQEVEDHRRNFKFSNNKTSVTACNDSLNAKTSNVNFVCVTCGKCVLNDNHDMCVLHYINGVNSRTRQPIVVPISTREPKRTVNQFVATSHKKTVATKSTVKKPRNIIRKIYEQLVEIILFIVDSGCSKHMTGNLKLLTNFVEKILGTVKFGNDQIAPILGYGDLVQGTITIKRVYYVKGLNHNLFSVGQFCDADLEVAFRKSTCYIRDLKGNDLLTGSRGTYLYSITLQETSTPNPICLMAKATSSQVYSSKIIFVLLFELGKAKRKSFHTKTTPSSKRRLQLLHMDLCGPMRVESINGKKYVLVIVDDYSRYTWTHFLRSKDETPAILIDFLTPVQRGLHAQVRTVRTDKGTEFLNKTLHAYFAKEGIRHETSTARTPEQNGVVERWNRTLVEAARTMLSAAKVPLFFWAEAIATACFTQNRSLVIPRHEKTPYHIINGWKPSVKFFHIFGSLCYIVRDGENLDKMKEKGDACIFVGYSTQSRAYRITQENAPQAAETVTTSNELDLLFSMMFDELLNGTTPVVSKSSTVHAADAPDKRQHHNITQSSTTAVVADVPPLNIQTTPQTTNQAPTQVPTITANENIIQAETNKEYAQVDDDEFINVFSTLVQERGETSSRHVDSSNMHTFYQHHHSEHHWTKDHPLEQVIGNPSQSIRIRRRLETDGEICCS
ncbi:retrovirus-related pol polyprotein from transposon TNT 1-94 [Tanacetum coccineum]